MTSARIWVVLLLLVGSVALAACGGGDGDDDEPGPTMAVGGEPTDDGSEPTDDDGASSDTDAELQELAGSLADNPGTVTYTYSSAAGGETATGTFTLYWSPPDRWRIDLSDGSGSGSTFITIEGTTYLCSDASCFASPVTAPLPFLGFLTDPDSFENLINTEVSGVDFDTTSDEIAGQSVTCYTAAGTVEGQAGSAEYCFNDDGLLLRLDGGSDQGSFTLEATSAESEVSDADLELPFPVQEIPDF